jgi:hypothetical protein
MDNLNVSPFNEYKKIAIVGPQRSGTRFVSYAMAHDLGYHFADQQEVGLTSWGAFGKVLDKYEKVVVQAVGMTADIHKIKRIAHGDETLVVWVDRGVEDILASEARIRWKESHEVKRLPKAYHEIKPGCVARKKYYQEVQVKEIPHHAEIRYESLIWHPLFIDRAWALNGGKGMEWQSCRADGKRYFED